MKKLFILRGNTQSEKRSRSLSGLSASVCQTHFSWRWLPEPQPRSNNLTTTLTHKSCDLYLHLWWTKCILLSDTQTHTKLPRFHSMCPWKRNKDAHSTQTASHTHLQYARTHKHACTSNMHTDTHALLHSAPARGAPRVWHPLASCASNAAEKQQNKPWLWRL